MPDETCPTTANAGHVSSGVESSGPQARRPTALPCTQAKPRRAVLQSAIISAVCLCTATLAAACTAFEQSSGSDGTFASVTAPGIATPTLECGKGKAKRVSSLGKPRETPESALLDFVVADSDLPQSGYWRLGESPGYVVFAHDTQGVLDTIVGVSELGTSGVVAAPDSAEASSSPAPPRSEMPPPTLAPPPAAPARDLTGWAVYRVAWCENPIQRGSG
jgi:hypothetical protein